MIVDKLIEIAKGEVGYLEKSKKAVEADPDVLYDFTKGAGSVYFSLIQQKQAGTFCQAKGVT